MSVPSTSLTINNATTIALSGHDPSRGDLSSGDDRSARATAGAGLKSDRSPSRGPSLCPSSRSRNFRDNGFRVTLRARNFYRGEMKKAGMNVTANYKFVKEDGVFKAVRQGELEIFPPGFVEQRQAASSSAPRRTHRACGDSTRCSSR